MVQRQARRALRCRIQHSPGLITLTACSTFAEDIAAWLSIAPGYTGSTAGVLQHANIIQSLLCDDRRQVDAPREAPA